MRIDRTGWISIQNISDVFFTRHISERYTYAVKLQHSVYNFHVAKSTESGP